MAKCLKVVLLVGSLIMSFGLGSVTNCGLYECSITSLDPQTDDSAGLVL
ncbi:MAG: hypothetical protein MJY64_02810 [archaeon]|nr:hypothetical protein [archaeon]